MTASKTKTLSSLFKTAVKKPPESPPLYPPVTRLQDSWSPRLTRHHHHHHPLPSQNVHLNPPRNHPTMVASAAGPLTLLQLLCRGFSGEFNRGDIFNAIW